MERTVFRIKWMILHTRLNVYGEHILLLKIFQTEYMKVSKVSYLTSCRDVLFVRKFEKPEIVKQNKYEAALMNRVFYRLNHLKMQTKTHR